MLSVSPQTVKKSSKTTKASASKKKGGAKKTTESKRGALPKKAEGKKPTKAGTGTPSEASADSVVETTPLPNWDAQCLYYNNTNALGKPITSLKEARALGTENHELGMPKSVKTEVFQKYRADSVRELLEKRVLKGVKGKNQKKSGPFITKRNSYFGPSKLLSGAGFGNFAAKNMVRGEVIEIAPILIDANSNFVDDAKLDDYTMVCTNKSSSVMLGTGSLFNHSSRNNVVHDYGRDDTIVFQAKRAIQKDEELFINYGKGWFSDRDVELK